MNTFWLVSLFLVSAVSCSFKFQCLTSTTQVREIFEQESKIVLKKAASIRKCGLVPEDDFVESYRPCILNLKLPKTFEPFILDFIHDNFDSEFYFKTSLEFVAGQACSKIKLNFVNAGDMPLTYLSYSGGSFEVDPLDYIDAETLDSNVLNTELPKKETGASLIGSTAFYCITGFIVLVAIVFGFVFYWRRQNFIKRKNVISATSNLQNYNLPSYSSDAFDSDPPSYEQAQKQELSEYAAVSEAK